MGKMIGEEDIEIDVNIIESPIKSKKKDYIQNSIKIPAKIADVMEINKKDKIRFKITFNEETNEPHLDIKLIKK